MQTALLWAASGTGFTFLMTTLGAASVFLFRKRNSMAIQRAFLGFAAGVMIAASVWSLLIPAIERAEEAGQVGWIPAAGGFVIGVAFLMVLHQLLPHLHPGESKPEGLPSKWDRPTLLFTAVTLHNIPEGMAIGVAFGSLAYGLDGSTAAGAWMLALGIGLQNLPEGMAVSVPLRREGYSRGQSVFYGQLSGVVEPFAAVLGALLVLKVRTCLPFLLAFAAGAMIYVVGEELIPESQTNENKDWMALFTLVGFSVMMVMDVAFG